MATFLTPDKTITAKVGAETITIKQKIIPDGAKADKDICSYIKKGDLVKPNKKIHGDGKPQGICVHNTNTISVASGTNPAEQYSRATFPNGNMGGVVVHYYVYKSEIWQNLADNEQGWHSTDGATRKTSQRGGNDTVGGNLDTVAIEIIESAENKETEATAAKLVAYLLDKYDLSPDTDIYTHKYFYPSKNCPAYILPHLDAFLWECKKYYNAVLSGKTISSTNTSANDKLYRVQVGAFSERANADNLLAKLKVQGYEGFVVGMNK